MRQEQLIPRSWISWGEGQASDLGAMCNPGSVTRDPHRPYGAREIPLPDPLGCSTTLYAEVVNEAASGRDPQASIGSDDLGGYARNAYNLNNLPISEDASDVPGAGLSHENSSV